MNETSIEEFLNIIISNMDEKNGITTTEIYNLFPNINNKTISWRLYKLVQEKKLFRNGHGNYTIKAKDNNLSMGYDYMSIVSKKIYNESFNYGYNFYISGIDSLAGELLHIPENYPVIVVVEKDDINNFAEILSDLGLFVITEKNKKLIEYSYIKKEIDVLILKGKRNDLSIDNIAIKEKAFIDLYYAVTRLNYPFSIQELKKTYENLNRNKSITKTKMKQAAQDLIISTEISWLLELDKFSKNTKEFMYNMLGD
ncbi:MAG: hypothetical protein K0Q49_2175 [Haloplasmataceae bacterium]|jgi:hypothetical protein|nr:hypothetical protein [Haloplasmataceae bacterium]